MSKLLLSLTALLVAVLPAHAQKTKAQISAEIITLFPDNTVGAITPTALRTVTNDLAISIMPTAPVVSGNLACFDGTTGLLQDCGSAPLLLVVGTSVISSGTSNGVLYNNAGVLANTAAANGGLLNTSSSGVPSITATPVIGVAGSSVGSIGFQNVTSGTVTLSPPAGALGTVTLTMPAATDQLVARATTDTLTNKTYNAQGTGNVFQLDSVTVTGKAAASDYYAGSSTAKVIAPNVIYPAEVDLGNSGSGTQTIDFSTFINARTTMTGNISTQTLSNVTAGKAGTITFIQDGTGTRTTVWNTIFKFPAGTIPALSTAINTVDVLTYSCRSATFCIASLIKDVRNP